MNFTINPEIFKKFPGLTIGLIVFKNVDNTGKILEIETKTRAEEIRIRETYNAETLSQQPFIDVWRKTYSAFGAKPKEHRSSIENLYRLILQGINLRSINPLVDIYNFISLKYMVPVGGEDLDKTKGDIALTFAGENEPAVLLLGDKELKKPHPGEVIYRDEISAICRRWNWRECDRTKFTENTKNGFLVLEGLLPVTRDQIESATKELSELVKKYCGSESFYTILEEKISEIDLSQHRQTPR